MYRRVGGFRFRTRFVVLEFRSAESCSSADARTLTSRHARFSYLRHSGQKHQLQHNHSHTHTHRMPKSPPQATQYLPVFLRHHSDFFVNAFLVRVAMPMPNSRCCFAIQVRCFYGCEGPAVLLCGAEDAASTPTLTQTVTLAMRDEKQVACWTEWLATTSSAPWVRIGAHWHLPSCVIFLFLFSIHRLLPDGGGGGGS